jgi:glycosyltransferase involved in cell wall biosynthesis
MKEDIMVSICCITYNQAKYITQALESFIQQKTLFRYEVLIHDDASTDGTDKVITEYAAKYPDIVKPVFEKENQYSKGVDVNETYNFSRAKGKYIALCEGDDYWTSDSKLARQVEYMESNPECTLCFHNAEVVGSDGQIIRASFFPVMPFEKYFKKYSSVYTPEEIILLDFAPTNSLMFRTADAHDFPAFFHNGVCGDLPLRIYMASKGYAYYIHEVMSAYRKGVAFSASALARKCKGEGNRVLKGHLYILDQFNEMTRFKYNAAVQKTKELKLFMHYFINGSKDVLLPPFKGYFNALSLKMQMRYFAVRLMPRTFAKIRELHWKHIGLLSK